MPYVKLFLLVMRYAPQILNLLKELEKNLQDHQDKEKLKNDLEAITDAFKNNDADALKRVFNSE